MMDTKDNYWSYVEDLAKSTCAIPRDVWRDSGEWMEFVDEAFECVFLVLPKDILMRIVSWSKNPNAFHEWDPKDVEPGSDCWWHKRAFYAATNDTYDRVRDLRNELASIAGAQEK